MVVSTNFYHLNPKDASFLSKLLAIAIAATCLSIAYIPIHSKKSKEAFAKEKRVQLVKIERHTNRHGSILYAFFDANGNPADYEYCGFGCTVDKSQEGQTKSGQEFIQEYPRMSFNKAKGKIK